MTHRAGPVPAWLAMAKILVTGSNGHLGSALVRELLARGHEVVPLVLAGTSLEGLIGLKVTPVVGDVTSRASVQVAVAVHLIEYKADVGQHLGLLHELHEERLLDPRGRQRSVHHVKVLD